MTRAALILPSTLALLACGGGGAPPVGGPACAGPANAPWSLAASIVWADARVVRDPAEGTILLTNGVRGATLMKVNDQGMTDWLMPQIPGYARAVSTPGANLAIAATSVSGPTGSVQVKLTPFGGGEASVLGDDGHLDARFVAIVPTRGFVVGGAFQPKDASGDTGAKRESGFIAELLASGEKRWLRRFGDPGVVRAFAFDGLGHVGALLWTDQATKIDDLALTPAHAPGSGFFVSFDADGRATRALDVTEDGSQTFESVAVGQGARVFVSGVVPSGAGGGEDQLYVAAFEPTGQHVWTQRFSAAARSEGSRLAVDECGDVLMIGNGVGKTDGFLAVRMSRDGDVIARVDVKSSRRRVAQDLAPAPGGAVVVGAEGDALPDGFAALVAF